MSAFRPPPGDLPGLKILSKLGEGGMSRVWKAEDLDNGGRIVAVKLPMLEFAASKPDAGRFEAEARAMQELDHPGIVKSFGMRGAGPWRCCVMEYVDGYNFGSLLARKQHLSEGDCLLICESVALALDYAWNERGIVHCDIKPDNIMIDTSGTVKLTDLGLCHVFSGGCGPPPEVPDHVLGTPAYISPEQVYGDVEPDCRADVYSLAATLYHLATGRVLFHGMTADGMMRAHCDESMQAYDPRRRRPALSEGFCQMLEAMLVKDRDGRLAGWPEVYAACREIEAGNAFKPRSDGRASSLGLGKGL